MIFGKLEDLKRLVASKTAGIGSDSDFEASVAEAIRWLDDKRLHGLLNLKPGRHLIAGSTSENGRPKVYANVEMTTLRAPAQANFERHRHYADIQIVLSGGEEAFEVTSDPSAEGGAYSEERDLEFFEAEALVRGVLRPGFFALYRSGEPHKPALVPEGKTNVGPIRKIVIKVLDDGWCTRHIRDEHV